MTGPNSRENLTNNAGNNELKTWPFQVHMQSKATNEIKLQNLISKNNNQKNNSNINREIEQKIGSGEKVEKVTKVMSRQGKASKSALYAL